MYGLLCTHLSLQAWKHLAADLLANIMCKCPQTCLLPILNTVAFFSAYYHRKIAWLFGDRCHIEIIIRPGTIQKYPALMWKSYLQVEKSYQISNWHSKSIVWRTYTRLETDFSSISIWFSMFKENCLHFLLPRAFICIEIASVPGLNYTCLG